MRVRLGAQHISTAVYRFPTPEPEADGTLTWDATTVVTAQISAGGHTGLGWTYLQHRGCRRLDHRATGARGAGPRRLRRRRLLVGHAPRLPEPGHPRPGYAGRQRRHIALWDLKARLLTIPLTGLLGRVRDTVPVYGSGGFTTLTDHQLDQ